MSHLQKSLTHFRLLILLAVGLAGLSLGCTAVQAQQVATNREISPEQEAQRKRKQEERRQFQSQELITGKSGTWIFNADEPPRIVWRDPGEVRRLGGSNRLRVRWFDAKLNQSAVPNQAGRWGAWIEGVAPNGTPLRRSLTFYARPKNFLVYYAPDLAVSLPHFLGPIPREVWGEHEAELSRLSGELLVHVINDSEAGAILMAGLGESMPLGRPAHNIESTGVLNEDYHLALKLKIQGLQGKVRPLQPPRHRAPLATMLHEDLAARAGVNPDAKAKIDAVCCAWADDTAEPFVTLVARRGVIVTHRAFGRDKLGNPIALDYRCSVASITKTVTALLFSQFLDQGLIDLDDSLALVFPDYPKNDPHVPTFRQCFNHTSGLSGHGDFGGMCNPHLENIILNAIDVNQPNVKYSYSGMGFDLAAKAMEIVAGRSAARLYQEHLFGPLGFGDVFMGNGSSDGRFTAMELGVLAQWIANEGSYGELEFISSHTFERLLPQPLHVPDHGSVEDEGIGMHWIRHLKAGAPQNSKRSEDLLFGPRTIGHGSLTGCIFLIDPEQQLVVTQVRRQSGPRSAEWSARFYQTIVEHLER
jgi:CubicO group peptidase (beta-lactamase class C family)